MRVLIGENEYEHAVTHDISEFPENCKFHLYNWDSEFFVDIDPSKNEHLASHVEILNSMENGVVLGVTIKNRQWKRWDEHTIRAMEMCLFKEFFTELEIIKLERGASNMNKKCKNEFVWDLSFIDEINIINNDKVALAEF